MAADGASMGTQRRRILMTADTLGGTWTYALELARALGESGHEVALATMGRLPDRAQSHAAAAIPGLELHASTYRLLWMDEPWRDVEAAGDWLLALSERVRPDVVHLNDLGHCDLHWGLPVLAVVHSCVSSWWRAVHGCAPPSSWARYADHVHRGLQSADLVVAPTHAMLGEADRLHGPLGATRVIPNARSAPPLASGPRATFVLSAGRLWDEGKNVAALAAAAPKLVWPVLVAGADGAYESREVAACESLVRLGQMDAAALRHLYARASIYALPARYEPFGLSVLEAAQAGCALVLGDIPSLRENWDGAALFVEPDDKDALASALQRVIRNSALRFRLGGLARTRAAQRHFAPRAMARAYADAYTGLLAHHEPEVASHTEELR